MRAPGGQIIAGRGGFLELWNWRNPGSPTAPPIPTNYAYLDVAHYRLRRQFMAASLWYSGCFGSLRARVVAIGWQLSARVWWDYEQAPATIARADALALKAYLGEPSLWTGNAASDHGGNVDFQELPPNIVNHLVQGIPASGLGLLDDGDSYVPFYAAPLCLLSQEDTIDPSEPDDDGIVYQDLVFVGDSLCWYIPDQQVESRYSTYVGNLASQGFIPYVP